MRRKLIEVALPLDEINAAGAREKSIRHGHPSTLHLWWSRKPLAVARAVIFGQLVDDPSSVPEEFPTADDQAAERERLFGILRELVKWENTGNETVLGQARAEIRRSWRRTCADNAGHARAAELFDPERLPAFHDPFAGGGALPLEAQRLGLEAHASDLNPVAVLINKAMIEIPPKFAGRPPVNPEDRSGLAGGGGWPGASGLAADVRYYGRWMRAEAEKRIGHLYPKAAVTADMAEGRSDLAPYVGRELTVIAWLWARTVRSPNPAFADVEVPLASSFVLSSRKGKEAYVEPVIEGRGYRFEVRVGTPPEETKRGTTAGKRNAFRCLMSGVPVTYPQVREFGQKAGLGARLMAVVAEGDRGRVYLSPLKPHERAAQGISVSWRPDQSLPDNPRDFKTPNYGMPTFADLFTDRQLVALTTFSDLVAEAQEKIAKDALGAGLPSDGPGLAEGGTDALAYAQAVGVYLGLCVSRQANRSSSLCFWHTGRSTVEQVFARQALPMVWDYCEGNPFSASTGNFMGQLAYLAKVIAGSPNAFGEGSANQADATTLSYSGGPVVSTDPPYYDNIGYADLSDFFYVWLRRSLRFVLPNLFATLAAPKSAELVATPYRHGSTDAAEEFFLGGMGEALARLAADTHPTIPVTIYYAYKQSEQRGWETFLEAVIGAGFAITGTWPMRTELPGNLKKQVAALASSIVLVCTHRSASAPISTRREFTSTLRSTLRPALRLLQSGNIAPVDLAQAAIGPGMSVYTRYEQLAFAA